MEDGIHAVKDGLLVLLHILVVRKRQSFHDGEKRHQVAVAAPRLAAHKLRNIRVLLLRHDARARGIGVVQLDKVELPRTPEDDLLREAGKMHHHHRDAGGKLDHKIPVRNAVHAVFAGISTAQGFRRHSPVGGVGRSRKRAAPERGHGSALFAGRKAAEIPLDHVRVGHQVVAEGDGLRALQMGVARHDRGGIGLRLVKERFEQRLRIGLDLADRIHQVKPEVDRHLVVAAARGVQLLADIAHPLCELRLHEHVDIFRNGVDGESTACDIIQNGAKPGCDHIPLRVGQDARMRKHRHMRERPGDILPEHARIEGDGRVEIVHVRIKLFLEAPCPHRLHRSCSPVYLILPCLASAFILMERPNRSMKPLDSA